MSVLSNIFNTLNMLHVHFDGEDSPAMELVVCREKKGAVSVGDAVAIADIAAGKSRLGKAPVVVAVSGKGVVTKDAAAGGIVETVVSDPATFLWTHSADGTVSFTRRAGLEKTMAMLDDAGIVPLCTECLPGGEPKELAGAAERFYARHLKWKMLLKPSAEGSALASMLVKRLMLPVLGVVLLALVVNFMLSARVRDDFQAANTELSALKKSASSAAASTESRRAAIEEFSRTLPIPASRLADRIGALVPDKMILNELSIAPVMKSVEAGKPVKQNERSVIIRGESSSADAIAAFAGALGGLGIGAVSLSLVEQDMDIALLIFLIEIAL